ncbi:uncharacterized protein LOC131643253 [Vicia villosa]|uniref:uncharacterized protein LOC131643253 n=1 Tax=Vicia villosa TaxID=3911 RepID=UPI00273CE271|nr:uncharacterized protein LOC131643253 [Vicia villosa]
MRIEELQSSLEAQELRLTERTSEREVEQALKASFVKKDQKLKKHGRSQKSEVFYSDEEKHQKGKEKYDKRMVQCYCCNRFGHFAKDCWSNKEEAKIARGDSDDEPVLLMAYESDEEPVKSKDDFEDSGEDSESKASEDKSELESSEGKIFGGHASGREKSEDIGSGGQASKDDHVSSVNHDVEGGTSEGGASEGSPASDGGHDSERKDSEVGTSEGRASEGDPTSKGGGLCRPRLEQDPEVNKGGTSGGSKTSEENPEGDMVPESEGDFELLGIEEALDKKGWLNAIKEELEALEGNKTWKLTTLPKEKKTISVRWVFKEKSALLNGVSEVAHCSNQKKLVDVLMNDVKTVHLIRLRDGVGVVDSG